MSIAPVTHHNAHHYQAPPAFQTTKKLRQHQVCRLERWQYNPFMSFLPGICTLFVGIMQHENKGRVRKIGRGLTGLVPLVGGPLLNYVDNGTCCGRRPGLDD